MKNKKLTAVDYIYQKLQSECLIDIANTLFDQAKAMEKEQIKDAYMVCDNDSGTFEESEEYAEQYYNRTYGK